MTAMEGEKDRRKERRKQENRWRGKKKRAVQDYMKPTEKDKTNTTNLKTSTRQINESQYYAK